MTLQENASPEDQWQEMKQNGAHNEALDELMNMVGLHEVKTEFLRLKDKIELERKYYGLRNERFTTVFLGNPGTGKTTVARLYSQFLQSLDIFRDVSPTSPHWTYLETSGSSIANQGVGGLENLIQGITSSRVGAIFIDEAYQLVNGHNGQGPVVLDFLLGEIENLRNQIVFIFAGYRTDMEKFFAHNIGIRGRIGYTFKFEDYDETQLEEILHSVIERKYGGAMKVEPCSSQPSNPNHFAKIVARRISSSRDQEGFANARAVENVVFQIATRLSRRLKSEERDHDKHGGKAPNYFLMTEEDLLGPSSPRGLFGSKAWKELEAMIGLKCVKESVRSMIAEIQINRLREIQDKPTLQRSLNKVFLGNPGTGKTTVAKLYGQILVELGMLSNGEVVVKTPADFIGQHLGGSEHNTKMILESTKGKVLVIDEAYQLNTKSGAKDMHGATDSFKSAVINTLVANVHSQAGDDRCVLLLGYKDQMEHMFQDANPGLKRRFPLENAFVFEDFTTDELRQIWRRNIQTRALDIGDGVEDQVIETLERQRHKLNFGNAGEVDIILDSAQKRYQQRIRGDPSSFGPDVKLELSDIDPDFERLVKAAHDVDELFKGVIGCDEVKKVISSWPHRASAAKKLGLNIPERIPMTMCFAGPPGTGKTTTAKNIGTVLYSIGLLASNEVNVISTTDLVGRYIGHTGPKVRQQFEASLGKVLFIDEAYRLCDSNFGKDAVNEIVTCLTEDKFKGHLVVIFAGYEEQMRDLMDSNPGMGSRIQETIHFPSLSAADAAKLLDLHVNKSPFNAMCLKQGRRKSVLAMMNTLVRLPRWANGRSIDTLSKRITDAALDERHPDLQLHGATQFYIKKKTVMRQLHILQEELNKPMTGPRNSYTPEASLSSEIQTTPPKIMISQKTPPKTTESIKTSPEDTTKVPPKSPGAGGHELVANNLVASASKRTYGEYNKANPALQNESTHKKPKLVYPSAATSLSTEHQQSRGTAVTDPNPSRRPEIGNRATENTEAIRRVRYSFGRPMNGGRRAATKASFESRAQLSAYLQLSKELREKKASEDAEMEKAWAAEEERREEVRAREEKEERERREREEEEKKEKEKEEKEKEEKEKEEKEKEKEKEKERQRKLGHPGQCHRGFDWIDMGNGRYQCAGGSHSK